MTAPERRKENEGVTPLFEGEEKQGVGPERKKKPSFLSPTRYLPIQSHLFYYVHT